MNRRIWFAIALAVSGGLPAALWADTVQLVNGDSLSGKVVSLNEEKLQLKSEVIGEVIIPRAKIAAVYFGDFKPREPEASAPGVLAPARNPPAVPGPSPTPEDILKQLQGGTLGAAENATIKDLQKQFPLLAQPEVQAYFQDTVGGLLSGRLSVNDIRDQAIDARKQLDDLGPDLGPGADQVLKPYKTILDKFIRETEPKK